MLNGVYFEKIAQINTSKINTQSSSLNHLVSHAYEGFQKKNQLDVEVIDISETPLSISSDKSECNYKDTAGVTSNSIFKLPKIVSYIIIHHFT